ncbi:translation initiation factor IF-2 [Streptomyces sp. NPDC088923]|uniref:translation initiation factor IF-2 n=1 Tax=Streptomyces sp. NPDC088923 TaxID=3365913 RepID=UPI00382093CD
MTGPADDDQRRSPETGATASEEARLRRAFTLIATEFAGESAGESAGEFGRAPAGQPTAEPTAESAAVPPAEAHREEADTREEADDRVIGDAREAPGTRAAATPLRAPTPELPIPPRLLRRPRPAWRRARAIGAGLVALAACVTLVTVVARTSGGDADSAGGASDDRAAAKTVRRCDSERVVVSGELTAVRTLPDGRVRLTLRVSDWLRSPSGGPGGGPTARFDVPAPTGDAYETGQRVLVEIPREEAAPPHVTTGEGATQRRLRVLDCDRP